MQVDLHTIFLGGLAAMVSTIAWFLKRDIHRFEEMMRLHHAELSRHNEILAGMAQQIATVLEVGKWNGNLQRFFGEGGGQARIWRSIEELQFNEQQFRERLHWIANKLAVLKGSMEVQGMKCGDPSGWVMPEWKSMKERDTK